jgi:two-component system chemotaxis sensor kinase CheA
LESKESQYRELFYVEASDNHEEINRLFTILEKNHLDQNAIGSIFRIVHTIKGNAMGIGLDDIANLSHVMEDTMVHVKDQTIVLETELINNLYRANDKLGELIKAVKTKNKVSYLGIQTKLSIYLKKKISDATVKEVDKEVIDKKGGKENTEIELSDSESQRKKDLLAYVESDIEEVQEGGNYSSNEASAISFTDVIQIPIKKMDDMVNLIGQLIIERDRLITEQQNSGKRSSKYEVLQRISSNLQYSIMDARMMPIGFLFNKFHRIVRDVSVAESKEVSLELHGTDVEIDRNILKIMSDSLIHLVRNAIGHGLENPEVRLENGKNKTGNLSLSASYEKDNVAIRVSDDGNGINPEIIKKRLVKNKMVTAEFANKLSDEDTIMYIFEAGFSNADKITDISGRGIGMDVVKQATESIGGHVSIDTEVGKHTTIKLLLPTSLALKGALLFEVNNQEYAIALVYIESVLKIPKKNIHKLNGGLIMDYQKKTISLVFLSDLLLEKDLTNLFQNKTFYNTLDGYEKNNDLEIIVVNHSGKQTGIIVDKLLLQKEIIEKPLEKPLDKVKFLTGTTILGNGKVCPVLDIAYLTTLVYKQLKS